MSALGSVDLGKANIHRLKPSKNGEHVPVRYAHDSGSERGSRLGSLAGCVDGLSNAIGEGADRLPRVIEEVGRGSDSGWIEVIDTVEKGGGGPPERECGGSRERGRNVEEAPQPAARPTSGPVPPS